jgi:LysM repeat protein
MNRFFEKGRMTAAVAHIKKIVFVSALFAACIIPSAADTTHIVQKGETLYSLSRTYHITVADICKANNIADSASVKAGQKLIIPGADTGDKKGQTSVPSSSAGIYVVQKGDTWYGIAHKSGISVKDLLALNVSESSAELKIGQKIKVPSSSSLAPADFSSSASSAATESVSVKNNSSASEKTKRDSTQSQIGTGNNVLTLPDIASSDPHNYSDKKGDSSLVWPVQTSSVTYVNGKVSGVKLAAKKNEAVTAIRAGTVMFSGLYRGFGNVVFIQSKTGHIYAYTGLGSVKVTKGDYITFGDEIGTAGVDSYTEKPQMNLMVFQNGLPIDPAKAPRG